MSINQRKDNVPGIAGIFSWVAGNSMNASWVTLLGREVFEQDLNYLEVVDRLSQTVLLAPVYYIIAGTNEFQVSLSLNLKIKFFMAS